MEASTVAADREPLGRAECERGPARARAPLPRADHGEGDLPTEPLVRSRVDPSRGDRAGGTARGGLRGSARGRRSQGLRALEGGLAARVGQGLRQADDAGGLGADGGRTHLHFARRGAGLCRGPRRAVRGQGRGPCRRQGRRRLRRREGSRARGPRRDAAQGLRRGGPDDRRRGEARRTGTQRDGARRWTHALGARRLPGPQAGRRRRHRPQHRRHGRVQPGAACDRVAARDRRTRGARADRRRASSRGDRVPRRPLRRAHAHARRAQGPRVQLPLRRSGDRAAAHPASGRSRRHPVADRDRLPRRGGDRLRPACGGRHGRLRRGLSGQAPHR